MMKRNRKVLASKGRTSLVVSPNRARMAVSTFLLVFCLLLTQPLPTAKKVSQPHVTQVLKNLIQIKKEAAEELNLL